MLVPAFLLWYTLSGSVIKMAFDGIAVARIVTELNQKLINARMVKIYQPDRYTIIMHLRSLGETNKLVISADPVFARIHTTTDTYINPHNPPAFCMLLRKYLEPSRILGIEQYQLERIIEIKFETFDPNLGTSLKSLVFELMGRNSNIILIDQEHNIIDAIHRNSDADHERPIMPGLVYSLPPVDRKINPLTTTEAEFTTEIRLLPAFTLLYQGLVQLYQGFSPAAAKEICRRAGIDPAVVKQELTLEQISVLWQSLDQLINTEQQPVLVEDDKPDFYAYRLTGPVAQREFASLDQLLDTFYRFRIHSQKVRQKASSLQSQINTHLKRLKRKEQIHRNTLKQAADADKWQKMGELILANIYQIQKGDSELTAVDYYQPEQPLITIKLDPALSPSENAQAYFKKYTKAKNSKKITQEQLEKTIMERMYLEEVAVQLQQADDLAVVAEIEAELIREGFIRKRRSKGRQEQRHYQTVKQYQEFIASDGTKILLGRNNRQNDLLTFKIAKPEDIWLHAQNIPGSHVIIRTNQEVTEQALQEAAALAAYYSKNRTSPKVAVDYTERKNVHKPRGAKPGFVTYNNFRTIIVDPTKIENLPRKADRMTEQ